VLGRVDPAFEPALALEAEAIELLFPSQDKNESMTAIMGGRRMVFGQQLGARVLRHAFI
jgi:hypothetical protein